MLQDEKRATDEKKVNDFVSTLKEVQLTKYNSKPANLGKTLYTIDIFDKKHNGFELAVYDNDTISIFISNNSRTNYYKIKDRTLDIKYIDNFLST